MYLVFCGVFRFLYRGGGDKDSRAKEKEQNRERRKRARIRGITKSGRMIKGRGVFVSNLFFHCCIIAV